MQKFAAILLLVLTFSLSVLAQKSTAEIDFEKNRAKYTREHYEMGEDASSGYDYLFYKRGDEIVLIRSIGSATYSKEIRIDDLYFNNGLVFMRRSVSAKRNLGALKRGRDLPLASKEELHFVNGKLVRWVENGKEVDKADKRWAETEKQTLESAAAELENYKFLKDEKQ
jgi:hypothetical protein